MLVMTKIKTNLFDSFDNQNAGPKMNFRSVFTHTRDRCFVTPEYVYRLRAVVVKAMLTTSTHTILLENLLSDILMCLNGLAL